MQDHAQELLSINVARKSSGRFSAENVEMSSNKVGIGHLTLFNI